MRALILSCVVLVIGCAGEPGTGPCELDETLIGDDVIRLQSSAGQTCLQLRVGEQSSTRVLLTLRVHDGETASEQTDLTLLGWSQQDQRYWGHIENLDYFVDTRPNGSYHLTAYDVGGNVQLVSDETLVVGPFFLTQLY